MANIISVTENSPAHRAGICAGDQLLSINSRQIRDFLDYKFYCTEKKLVLEILRNGRSMEFHITKAMYADLGLEFETFLMDKHKSCRNKCIFCFIEQLPQKPPLRLRESLYFKDDDERLSFLFGNYITLTNLSESDIRRIIELRIAPVNISVHTTDPVLRAEMMGNKHAGTVLSYLKTLAEGGISLNTQIVLCKGVNDGSHLERTLRELSELYPAVQSIAVVPAGLTKYRAHLFPLQAFDQSDCRRTLDLIDAYGALNMNKFGERLIYAADEFYIKGELDIPCADYYEGYPQLENGVGMVRNYLEDFADALAAAEPVRDTYSPFPRSFGLVTGTAFAPFLTIAARQITQKFRFLHLEVIPVKNNFFGENITVAGLLTARDIIDALKGHILFSRPDFCGLTIPDSLLRSGDGIFLDGISLHEFKSLLAAPVYTVNSPESLLCQLLSDIC